MHISFLLRRTPLAPLEIAWRRIANSTEGAVDGGWDASALTHTSLLRSEKARCEDSVPLPAVIEAVLQAVQFIQRIQRSERLYINPAQFIQHVLVGHRIEK